MHNHGREARTSPKSGSLRAAWALVATARQGRHQGSTAVEATRHGQASATAPSARARRFRSKFWSLKKVVVARRVLAERPLEFLPPGDEPKWLKPKAR